MFFIQVLQVDFLADFQFTQVYTGLLFLPPDVRADPRAETPFRRPQHERGDHQRRADPARLEPGSCERRALEGRVGPPRHRGQLLRRFHQGRRERRDLVPFRGRGRPRLYSGRRRRFHRVAPS